jgi:hypothetical protein
MNLITSDKIQRIREGIVKDLITLHESEMTEELEECDGGTAFGDASGSATYDANAFGKSSSSIIKKKPYFISSVDENFIKEKVIRPVVEQYLGKFLN